MKKRIAILLVLAALVSIYAWMETGKMRFASAMKDSGDNSNHVVLERYYSSTVLQTARIPSENFNGWIDQLPKGLGRMPLALSKCWVPHHRIKFDGISDNKVEICFTCDEIWTEEAGRRRIPEDWQKPLRAMFQASGISDAAPNSNEEMQFLDAMAEETDKADTGQRAIRSESDSKGGGKAELESEDGSRK